MLKSRNRLTKRGSFAYVYKNGAKGSEHLLKMFFVRSSGLKIGFSVSNKIGKAHIRNKVKRRLRAAVRELMGEIKGGCQIVFSAKPSITEADYSEIKSQVFRLLDKNGLIKQAEKQTEKPAEKQEQ